MNTAALRAGTAKAKKLIDNHIVNQILIPMANDMLDYVVKKRISDGHNMTGNTINSYVVGVFSKGKLVYQRGSWESIPRPLTHKVYRYQPGRQRWDGETQVHLFPSNKGVAQHGGGTEPSKAIAFINSYQASPNGWTVVIANGIEYATYEENVYGADTLTGSIDYFKVNCNSFFKPIPD